MTTKPINFDNEAAKITDVLRAFQDEINRLTIENRGLHLKFAALQATFSAFPAQESIGAPQIHDSWEVAPNDDHAEIEASPEEVIPKSKRRGPNKPAQAETRCNALTPAIEMDATGQLVPLQCKRSSENGAFCKQHAASHPNFGTFDQPNLDAFTKNHDQLIKAFNKKNGIVEEKKKKRSANAVKRALNPYMMFLAVNRDRVKGEILAENPELKGRELAITITRMVGRLWQSTKGNVPDVSDECSGSDCTQSDAEIEIELAD
jgi:hypothetical protein